MKRVLLAVLLSVVLPAVAHAQSTRTWVSGVGDDVNPCSRTAPCKTFAGAISKTATGGEISVLDPGGFGAVTITKSITINGTAALAGILFSLTNAINVNVGGADTVILRNLSLHGGGNGVHGINIIGGGTVVVENVTIEKMTGDGIHFVPAASAKLNVLNVTITGAANGVVAEPGPAASARVSIQGSRILNTTGTGVKAGGNAVVTVRDTLASGNGRGFWASGGPGIALLHLDGCTASHNSEFGVVAGFGGNHGAVRMANTLVTYNGTGLFVSGLGFVDSFGDNKVIDNGTDGSPSRGLTLQ